MQVKLEHPSTTEAVMTVVPSAENLAGIKTHVLSHFNTIKVPGFRAGKAPEELLEKHIEPSALQSRFLEEAVEQLYAQAVRSHGLRPIGQPKISIKKFVPFATLEFEATMAVIGEIKLPDYKKMKLAKTPVKLTAEDVNGVLESVRTQLAEKKDVDRAAKNGDVAWIDFKGSDSKGEPVKGADGKDYPLTLGSNQFIPGFEENLIGLKPGEEKTFTLKFPKDYGVKALASKDVTFAVTVIKVQEVTKPKLDDALAAKAGPFKTLADLKADIKKQLAHEREHEANRQFESEIVKQISEKAKVDIPDLLIEDQMERMLQQVRQDITYRGQTFEEYLESLGKTEETYRKEDLRPQAEARTKAGLVLSEIADHEKLDVTPEELSVRLQLLKGQYQDEQMQKELDKPESRQEIASRILTEKTVAKLVDYVTK